MPNLLQQQDVLKGYQDDALRQELQNPTGIAPSFLVMAELGRRDEMRKQYEMENAQETKSSMAEEMAMGGGQGGPPMQQMPPMGGGPPGGQPPMPPQGIAGYAMGGIVKGYSGKDEEQLVRRSALLDDLIPPENKAITYPSVNDDKYTSIHAPEKVIPDSEKPMYGADAYFDAKSRAGLSAEVDPSVRRKPSSFTEFIGKHINPEWEYATYGIGNRGPGTIPAPESPVVDEPEKESNDITEEIKKLLGKNGEGKPSAPSEGGIAYPQFKRTDTQSLIDMTKSLQQDKMSTKGAALLRMGAAMMGNQGGNFGQVMSSGVTSGMDEFQKNKAVNRGIDANTLSALGDIEGIRAGENTAEYKGQVDLATADMYAKTRVREALIRAKEGGLDYSEIMLVANNLAKRKTDMSEDNLGYPAELARLEEESVVEAIKYLQMIQSGGGRGELSLSELAGE